MIIGAYNTEYTFTIAVPQQFSVVGGVNQYGGEDIETLLQALQPLDQVLTDVEGGTHLVRITQISPAHTGGQPYYYEVDVTFTDTGLAPPPSTIYVYGYMGCSAVGNLSVLTPSSPISLPTPGTGLRMVTDGTYFYVSTTLHTILKMDRFGSVLATASTGDGNAVCLWYDGTYLYANCGGTNNPVYKLNPSDLSVVASNTYSYGGQSVLTLIPDGNIYFTRGNWLQEYDPTLTTQLAHANPSYGNSGYEIIYDGTYLWWMTDSDTGGMTILDTSLNILKYPVWPGAPVIGTLAYIGGVVYGGDNAGNIYSMSWPGSGSVTFTHILTVPNAGTIASRITQIGSYVYIATYAGVGNPAVVYVYNYPAFTLAKTITLPDSETVALVGSNVPYNPYTLVNYNGYPMLLTTDAIYNVNAISQKNATGNYTSSGGIACVLPTINTKIGDCVIVTVAYGYTSGGNTVSLVDSAGNTYTQLTYINGLGTGGSANGRYEIWGSIATYASASNVITITPTSGSGKMNASTSSYLNVLHFGSTNAMNLGNTNTLSISVSTSEDADWIVGGFVAQNSPTMTPTVGTQRYQESGSGTTVENTMDNSNGSGTLTLTVTLSVAEYSGGAVVVLRPI